MALFTLDLEIKYRKEKIRITYFSTFKVHVTGFKKT